MNSEHQQNGSPDPQQTPLLSESRGATMFLVKKRNFIFLIIVTFLLGTLIPVTSTLIIRQLTGMSAPVTQKQFLEYQTLKERYGKLKLMEDYVNDNYYLPIEEDTLKTGLYKGLFESVGDPYTVYYTAEAYRSNSENVRGEFAGIGAYLTNDPEGNVVIAGVIEGTSAEKKGLKEGDIIETIDGKSWKGAALTDAVAQLRGEEGTEVAVRIRRGGEAFDVTLIRTHVVTPSVSGGMLEETDIGYIQIATFGNQTAEHFETLLKEVEDAQGKGLIIDLRNNPGGLVESGVAVADLLLDAGVVATAEGKNGKLDTYTTTDGKISLPYVILINEGTASTSEILAGAVQDNGGGKLVGTKTTGKGIIQRLEQFYDGDGARITVAQYFTPNGNPVHEIGITPDYVVELPEDATTDLQLKKALELLQ